MSWLYLALRINHKSAKVLLTMNKLLTLGLKNALSIYAAASMPN